MRIYAKRTPKNKIKQHIKQLTADILIFIGIISILNTLIEYAKTLPDITKSKTIIIYEANIKDDNNDQENQAPSTNNYLNNLEKDYVKNKVGIFSAYNAEIDQTDNSPDIMASGKKVYVGAIANNCLPFSTKVKINNKIYIVEDRMNSRYDCDYFDIFFAEKNDAINFGRKQLNYEIL